jgi:G:T-mismatch repair DNA endonuclease (very short patch repair protein)
MAYLKRREPYVRKRKRSERVKKPVWIDPFPEILGTKPEKMVFAELYRRQVPFSFQVVLPDFPFTEDVENYRVDFLVESTKIVIEVNGDYWHSMPGMFEADSLRQAILEYAGYKVCVWWESDILFRLQELFAAEPLLDNPPVKGPPLKMFNATDDLKAMRRVAGKRRKSAGEVFKKTSRSGKGTSTARGKGLTW